MLRILKLIYTTFDNIYNTTAKETIDVKAVADELMTDLLSIKKDFDLMEEHFNEELDTVIADKKKFLDKSVLVNPNKEEEETKREKNISVASSEAVTNSALKQILREIVFVDFLLLYNECSYAINERIKKMFEKYELIENAIVDLKMDSSEYEKIKEDLKSVEYRDLFYFLYKLEEKSESNFNIRITDMRNILYGCNPNDPESREKQIQEFYAHILIYERLKSFSSKGEKDHFLRRYACKDGNSVSQQEAMSNYIKNFKKDFSYLYRYHQIIPETFTVSKIRFSHYKDFLDIFKKQELLPSKNDRENNETLADYFISLSNSIETGLRGFIFEYLDYNLEDMNTNNRYSFYLKEVKQVLQSL